MLPKLIDGRGEKWKDWVEKFLTYGWQRQQLDAGDFRFWSHSEKTVGIEVKSVADLTRRLNDARRELAQMIDQVDVPILLVWGQWLRRANDELVGTSYKLTMKHVWNLLQTFQDSGLRFQLSTSRPHAFLRINQLYAYYQEPDHESNLVRRSGGNDRRISLLMGIPGISRELAKRLLTTFPSLEAIANAPEVQLKSSYNIGDSRARMIWNYFHSKEPMR